MRGVGIHVYLWPIHVDIWQKPSQCCNYPPIKYINLKKKETERGGKKRLPRSHPQTYNCAIPAHCSQEKARTPSMDSKLSTRYLVYPSSSALSTHTPYLTAHYCPTKLRCLWAWPERLQLPGPPSRFFSAWMSRPLEAFPDPQTWSQSPSSGSCRPPAFPH